MSSGVGRCGHMSYVSLAEVLVVRPSGVREPETWALLCQAVQALQDLFLSDGISGGRCLPLVSPSTLLLSSRGRVSLSLSRIMSVSPHLAGYLAPEYQPGRLYADSDIEKMLVFSLGETLKRATATSHSATVQLSGELCRVLATMGRHLPQDRASLMHLLDVISEYSRRREQIKPFSHTIMDLYRETIIYQNNKPIIMDALEPHYMKQHVIEPCSNRNEFISRIEKSNYPTIYSKWKPVNNYESGTISRNIFSSLEHINTIQERNSILQRPKSICTNEELLTEPVTKTIHPHRRHYVKRNPVKRAASRLYHASGDVDRVDNNRGCIGPEFVVRAALPCKELHLADYKIENTKSLLVIMLNGIKLDITCRPEVTTAGQLLEKIVQSESIEENFFLGLSVLISGDFVFLPSDVKLHKVVTADTNTKFTLFVRVRFFLPSLRGIRSHHSRHLLYLQLRRSILESQLPCSVSQLCELGGLALQAEFGDFSTKHESNHYFLIEHYIPETLVEMGEQLRETLTQAHIQRKGLNPEKSEEDFILLAQSLPYYGAHFYSASWISKSKNKDVWLCVSAQGLSLFERNGTAVPSINPLIHEIFKWQSIQTLCYSKHFLCILPHCTLLRKILPRKYKLKMDNKKSYYTFRLASLHHQFFLRLRTEYSSLQSLSQQFGILLKDIKNEANSLFKLQDTETKNPKQKENPSTEFKILFTDSVKSRNSESKSMKCKRSKSVNELSSNNISGNLNIPLEEYQNKENENPKETKPNMNTLPSGGLWDKRKGVIMGTRAFCTNGQRVCRSLEAVNAWETDEAEKISLRSSSRLSTSSSGMPANVDAYVLNATIKSCDDPFLPDLHESLSQSLEDKLKNVSFVDERILKSVIVYKDSTGSLGIQVTEGSDGKAYIQSVVPFGPASLTSNIFKGDQIVAVNNQNLLNLKYSETLQILKNTGKKIELILSQLSSSIRQNEGASSTHSFYSDRLNAGLSKITKTPTKSHSAIVCDICSNNMNCKSPHGSYDNRFSGSKCNLFNASSIASPRCLQRRCLEKEETSTKSSQIFNFDSIYKEKSFHPLEARTETHHPEDFSHNVRHNCSTHLPSYECDIKCNQIIPNVPLPRSLGLGRRWRGPVRYPVTPIKHANPHESSFHNASDDEQIFI